MQQGAFFTLGPKRRTVLLFLDLENTVAVGEGQAIGAVASVKDSGHYYFAARRGEGQEGGSLKSPNFPFPHF